MRNEIPEGYELIVGHSAKNAREALEKAEERGLEPQTVVRSRSGYLVPLGEAAEVTEPAATPEEAAAAAQAAAEASQGGTEDGGENVEDVEAEPLELPKKTANNEEIDAWRDEHLPGYEYPEDATNKELRIEALAAEVARHTALQEAEDAAAQEEGRDRVLLAYAPESKGE
jgi:hypothetical protein